LGDRGRWSGAERPDDTFSDRVRTRRSNGRGDGIDADALGSLAQVAAVHRVAITEQMPRLATPGRRLEHLPPDPGRRGTGGHVDVHQLTPTVGDEHQDVQRARAVLEPIPQREQAPATLVAAARPGGWVVVEDVDAGGPATRWPCRACS
jgi:hypothetical protein